MPHVKFVVAGILIAVAISYLMFSGVNDSMVYYYTVPEMLDKSSELYGDGVRVSGHVFSGTIQHYGEQAKVEFSMFERGTNQILPVVYQGIIPDTFKDNSEVVVEGAYDSNEELFHATVLLAKCPSKYEALGEEHPEGIPIEKYAN